MNQQTQLPKQIGDFELIFESIKPRFVEQSNIETFKRELSFAMQLFEKNKYLWQCSAQSKLEAILNISQTGLTLNPTKQLAYLIPRRGECHLQPSFQGIVKLVTDTGSVRNIYAHNVYEGDRFDEMLGTTPNIIHVPKRPVNRSKYVLTYAVAVLFDGSKQIEVMEKNEIEYIRSMSDAYQYYLTQKAKGNRVSCVWVDHAGEMRKKTVIKRLCKNLPKTENWDALHQAITLDNNEYQSSIGQQEYIYSLLRTAELPEDECASITRETPTMNAARAADVITYLKANQLDPIKSGMPYSQTDIKAKIKNEM